MKIAEAYVEVKAKSDTATARAEGRKAGEAAGAGMAEGVEKGSKNAKGASRKAAQSAASEFRNEFLKVASAAIALDQVSKSIQSASRLQQAVGATESVFKGASGTIEKFAKTSAESAGISAAAARELTARMGSLLQGMGYTSAEAADASVELSKLGADLAAAFGGRPEEAVQALGAAIRGETDPLEAFGISLNQTTVNMRAVEMGLASSTSAVDQHAKAQATLSLIMERSANVQGQFAREADTAAGRAAVMSARIEDARAEIGANLLPVMANAAEVVGSLADGFSKLPAPIQMGVASLAGLALMAGPIGKVVDVVGNIDFKHLGKDAGQSSDGVGKLAKALGILGAGLGVAAAVSYLSGDLFSGLHAINEEGAKVRDTAANARAFADGLLAARSAGVDAGDALAESFRNAAEAGNALFVTTVEGAPAEIMAGDLESMGLTVEQFISILEGGREALDAWWASNAPPPGSSLFGYDALSQAVDSYASGVKIAANEQRTMTSVFGEAGKSASDTADDIDEVVSAYKRLRGELSERSSFINVKEGFDGITEAYQNLKDAEKEGDPAKTEQAWRDLETATIGVKQSVLDYGDQLEGLPKERATEIVALIDQGKLAEAEFLLDQLEEDRTARLYVETITTNKNYYTPPSSYMDPTAARENADRKDAFGRTVKAATDAGFQSRAFDEILSSIEGMDSASRSAETAQARLSEALADLDKKSKRGRTTADELATSQRGVFSAALDSARALAAQSEAQAKLDGVTFSAADSARLQADELRRIAETVAPGSELAGNLQSYIDLLGKVQLGIAGDTGELDQVAARAAAMRSLADANLEAERSQKDVTKALDEYIGALFMANRTAEEQKSRTEAVANAEGRMVDAVIAEARARAEQSRLQAEAKGQTLSTAQTSAIEAGVVQTELEKLQGGPVRDALSKFLADLQAVGSSGSGWSKRGGYTNDAGGLVVNGDINVGSAQDLSALDDRLNSVVWRSRL